MTLSFLGYTRGGYKGGVSNDTQCRYRDETIGLRDYFPTVSGARGVSTYYFLQRVFPVYLRLEIPVYLPNLVHLSAQTSSLPLRFRPPIQCPAPPPACLSNVLLWRSSARCRDGRTSPRQQRPNFAATKLREVGASITWTRMTTTRAVGAQTYGVEDGTSHCQSL